MECYATMWGASIVWIPNRVVYLRERKVKAKLGRLEEHFAYDIQTGNTDIDKNHRKPVAAIYNSFMCVQQRL